MGLHRQFPARYLRRRWLARAACALLLCLWPAPASAAPQLQIITTVVNLAVSAADYDTATGLANVTLTHGLVFQVKSGNSWKLRLRTTRATFTTTAIPAGAKPVSDLQLRKAAGGSLLVPSPSYLEIARGGNTGGWIEFAYDVLLQATSADAGGTYSLVLEFDFY